MTDERNTDLARRLAELEPPDHRAGFWADLRADLANSTRHGPGVDADPVDNDAPANSTRHGSGVDVYLVENDEVSERRRRRASGHPLLAAAAVVLVAVVTAGFVLAVGDDGDTDVATDPTVTDAPATTAAPAGPLRPVGEPVARGIGEPLAIDPTGTFLYVAAQAPGGGFGCEGAPARALYVERVDGDGSDRRLAVDPELVDVTGYPLVAFSEAGEIAVVPRCEGYGSTVVTGSIADDGSVTEPTELAVPGAESILDIGFSGPGNVVVAAHAPPRPIRLVGFPTSPSEPTELGEEGVLAIDFTADGRRATVNVDGTVRVDGEEVAAVSGPLDIAVSPSGDRLVVDTEGGLVVVEPQSGSVSRPGLDVRGWRIVMIDDDTVVHARSDGAAPVIESLVLRTAERTPLVTDVTGAFALAPDAATVFVARFADDPAGPPVLMEQRLSR